jgi:hypothetical protein
MMQLSTGHDSTLGNYRKLAVVFFGPASEAVEYLDRKIAESPNKEDEEVIAAESQVIHLLASMEKPK